MILGPCVCSCTQLNVGVQKPTYLIGWLAGWWVIGLMKHVTDRFNSVMQTRADNH